jgi:hypothetical protein
MLGFSINPKLENGSPSGQEYQDDANDFQRRLEYISTVIFAISIFGTSRGVWLANKRRPTGLIMICISGLLFFVAWGMLLSAAGF